MTDNSKAEDWHADDMAAAIAKFSSKADSRKASRKARQKKLTKAGDGRSLRATGRTEQLNLKALPSIIAALNAHVGQGSKSLWVEQAILAKLTKEGYNFDA